MAKFQFMTLENLDLYDGLLKQYIDAADAKSLKTAALDGRVLKLYNVSEPVGTTDPVYELTLPETDISGLLAKLTGAVEGDVVVANADGTVKDGGVKLADLATKTEVEAVDDKADANATAIGILNGDETTTGSVSKKVKDAVDVVDAKIGNLADLNTTAKTDIVVAMNEIRQSVESGGTGSVVTISTDTTTEGYLKTYTIKQGTTEVGKIDIPKDIFPVSGSIVTNPDADHTGTFVKLILENQTEPLYVDVASLIDNYTAQASASQVQLSIDNNTREISATIVSGSIGTTELADNAISTAKIADGNVTLSKLGADVTPTLDQVATNKTNIEALQQLVGEGVEAISTTDIQALFD